ncbi:MAG: sigma-54 dependent transcriptional regulator [Tenuifilaceae bacterium]|jgi:DNA-binding NtrC family response regulator|nr:sigma-54 dependent transcriptional regulator [Tenuifilaceae bacterium]
MLKIFVVDDERIVRVTTADDLRDAGYAVREFASGQAAIQYISDTDEEVDLIITDLKMPHMDGLEFLAKAKQLRPNTFVLLMTAFATVDTAVQAMKLGAYDYISKPFNIEELLLSIERIKEVKEVKDENRQLRTQVQKKFDTKNFVGNSEETRKVFELVEIIANKDTTVLITGETGTGKEMLTNIIHFNSNRSKKPLVKVSCAILSREIFESELFGHEKGAFTGAEKQKIGRFELANSGTLYLDDIDDMPFDLQVKLLRALEEGEIERVGGTETIKIDVRVIASTKKDLKQMVAEGKFREDLFYRLNVFPISLPPLRERPDDIELLSRYFVEEFSQGVKMDIHPEAMELIKRHPFSGNVRELKNLMERLVLLASNGLIDKNILPIDVRFPGKQHTCFYFDNKPLDEIMREVETNAITDALLRSGGNKAKAAQILQVPASTLKSRIEKLSIKTP